MIRWLRAVEFHRSITSGRTNPLLLTCVDDGGVDFEVVAKFSGGCERRETALAMETIASCLAGHLGLPIPQPFVIETSDEWIEMISNDETRARLLASSRLAFGSKLLTPQYLPWHDGFSFPDTLVQVAAEILTFDAITQNSDRRRGNPNCLVRGHELRIIDHELTFCHRMLIGWRPPWEPGGLRTLETPGNHIFVDRLRGRQIDFGAIRGSWASLSDEVIAECAEAVPADWKGQPDDVRSAVDLIRNARDNIDGCIAELERVLT